MGVMWGHHRAHHHTEVLSSLQPGGPMGLGQTQGFLELGEGLWVLDFILN